MASPSRSNAVTRMQSKRSTFLFLDPTGIVASKLPDGRTIHSALFNFSVKISLLEFPSDMNTDQFNKLRHQIDNSTVKLKMKFHFRAHQNNWRCLVTTSAFLYLNLIYHLVVFR